MGFAEEFYKLDEELVEAAFAAASEELVIIAKRDAEMAVRVADMFQKIREASPGFMSIIGRYEEAVQMMLPTPGVEHGEDWFRMTEMMLGSISVGLVLAEYARLEMEAD